MARLGRGEFERKGYKMQGAWCLLCGPDEWRKQVAVDAVVKRALPSDSPDAMPAELDGEGLTASTVIASAQTPALFGGACVTVVHGVQAMRAEEQEALAKSLHRAAPGATVLLIAAAPEEGDGGRRVHLGLVEAVEKVGSVVEFDHPKREEAVKWVTAHAARLGSTIQPAAANHLVEMVGENLLELEKETEKLSLFAAGEKQITRAHVDQVVPRRLEDAVFEMAEAVADGKPGRALQLVDDMFAFRPRSRQREVALGLLGMIAGQFRLIWDAKRLIEAGWKPGDGLSEAQSALLAKPDAWFWQPRGAWKAQRLVKQAARLAWPQLAAAVDMLAEADLAAKEGDVDSQRLAIERLIVSLCHQARR